MVKSGTGVDGLIKWTVSLADFQPLSIAKTSVFIDNRGFTEGKIVSVPELRFVNSLRDSASFSRLKCRVKYSDFNPLTPVPAVTGRAEPRPFFHF